MAWISGVTYTPSGFCLRTIPREFSPEGTLIVPTGLYDSAITPQVSVVNQRASPSQ